MKDKSFLLNHYFINKGIYDNHKVFENTLEAFNEAIKTKEGLYFDVRLTKDKQLIVFDDDNLSRLLNLKDDVKDITYNELSYLSSYHIPLLKEVLTFVKGRVPIIINPKGYNKGYELEKLLSIELDNYEGTFSILSSNSLSIRWLNNNKPNYIVGEILSKKRFKSLRKIIANYQIKTDFKSVNINDYTSRDIISLKDDQDILIGYLINDQDKYLTYHDTFNSLIIDNYQTIQF